MAIDPRIPEEYLYLYFPLLLVFWLLPWIGAAVWIDRGWRSQISVRVLMIITAACCLELAAALWFGLLLIAPGIIWAGILIFLPVLVILSRRRHREQKKQEQLKAALGEPVALKKTTNIRMKTFGVFVSTLGLFLVAGSTTSAFVELNLTKFQGIGMLLGGSLLGLVVLAVGVFLFSYGKNKTSRAQT